MKTFLLIFCFGVTVAGCTKTNETPFKTQGQILGYDLRECPTPGCGGLEISIKNDTAKSPPPFYLVSSTLQQLGISESTKFPINVNFNYKPDTGIFARYNYIIITQIKVIK
jgi:hypothetical protein